MVMQEFEINGKKVKNMSEFFEAMESTRNGMTLVNTGSGYKIQKEIPDEVKGILDLGIPSHCLALLKKYPQYAEDAPWHVIFDLDYTEEWLDMLKAQPQLYVYAPTLVDLMELGTDFWEQTVEDYPQFADVYPCSLPDVERFALIHERHPEMVEQAFCYCNGNETNLVLRFFGGSAEKEKARKKALPLIDEIYDCYDLSAEKFLETVLDKGAAVVWCSPWYQAEMYLKHYQPLFTALNAGLWLELIPDNERDFADSLNGLEKSILANNNVEAVREVVDGTKMEHFAFLQFLCESELLPRVKRYVFTCGIPDYLKKAAKTLAPEFVGKELDWNAEELSTLRAALYNLPSHSQLNGELKKELVKTFDRSISECCQAGLLQFFLDEAEDPQLLMHLDYPNRVMYANMMIHIVQGKLSSRRKYVTDDWYPFGNSLADGDPSVPCHVFNYYFDPRHIYCPRRKTK